MTCLASFVRGTLQPRRAVSGIVTALPVPLASSGPSGELCADLRSALAYLDPNSYAAWVSVGQALTSLGEPGKALWLEWSARSPKFNDGKRSPDEAWSTFAGDHTGPAAIFAEAHRLGWANPARNVWAGVPLLPGVQAFSAAFAASYVAPVYQSNITGIADFLKASSPPVYIWHRVLQTSSLYALTAAWGAGKTAVAIVTAIYAASGRELCNRGMMKCRVLFLCGENPDDVKLRVLAACSYFAIDQAKLEGQIFFTRRPFSVDEPKALAEFLSEVEPFGPFGLCIVDTGPAHSSAEDENDNRTQHKLAMALRECMTKLGNPATVVLMHPAKGATRDTMQPRGGGAFSGSIDGELCLWNEGGKVEFYHRNKFRGPGFTPILFQLTPHTFPDIIDNFGEAAITVIAVPTDEKPIGSRVTMTGANRIALDALGDCRHVAIAPPQSVLDGLRTCGGQALFPPLVVVPEALWRERCYKAGISDGEQSAKAKAFGRSRKALLDLQQVQTFDGHVWLSEWSLPLPTGEPLNMGGSP